MALPKFTDDVNIHQSLSDTPNATEGYTPLQIKVLYDKAANLIKTWLNDVFTVAQDAKNAVYDAHLAEIVSYQTFVTRDLSLDGTQKIALPFKAKSILIKVTNSTILTSYCDGFCDEAKNQRCTYAYKLGSDVLFKTDSNAIRFTADNSNITDGNITLIEDDGFTITWNKIGSGATGTAVINILASTH